MSSVNNPQPTRSPASKTEMLRRCNLCQHIRAALAAITISLPEQLVSSTEGFTLVLAGLKAFLEHKIKLNLIADRFPGGIEAHS